MRGRRRYRRYNKGYRYVKKESEESKAGSISIISDEEGFIGDPKSWFTQEEFNKQSSQFIDYGDRSDSYFDSYSGIHIHEEMLKDRIRTGSYMDACLKNKEQFEGKIVLDIGCGTGILSIFAAKAGAKHVYGIDNAQIADAVLFNNLYRQNKL